MAHRKQDDGLTLFRVLWYLVKWPFQALAVFLAVALLVAWALVLQLPLLARSSGTDTFLLSLRVLDFDTARPTWPLAPFAVGEKLEMTAMGLRLPNDPKYDHPATRALRTKMRSPAQLEAARQAARALFDLDDPETRKHFLAWANGLLRVGLTNAEEASKLPHGTCPRTPPDLDEACLLALPLLEGIQPNARKDLPRLEALFAEAFPAEADRAAARTWAETLYRRLAELNREYLARQAATSTKPPDPEEAEVQALPPAGPGTYRWLLYQHVGLDAPSRAASADLWRGYFLEARRGFVENLGRGLEAARRADGEALPPPSEAVPWLCVVEHYQGTDRRGADGRDAITRNFSAVPRNYLTLALQLGNPSDDLLFIQAGPDPLRLIGRDVGTQGMITHVLMALLVIYGMRLLFFPIVAEFVLRLHHDPRYVRYRDGRGHGSFWVRLVGYVAVPLLAWGIALVYIPAELYPVAAGPQSLLLACFVAVLFGGLFVAFFTRVTAIGMLRCGIDIERVWYDEIVGLVLGVGLLWYFGNDPVTIGVFVLAEVLPMALQPKPDDAEPILLTEVD